ncbi:unnamed protein product [Closterium sp. NIES-65]|nr:unnamed protein product [Closterium sp. NIES-65]
MAVERAAAVNALADHVTNKVGEARKALEETVIKYIGVAQTNIAAAVTPRLNGSGGKGLSHKEIPAAKTAPGGAAKIGNALNAKIAEVTSVPKQPLAGARPPTGASADVPSADKDGRAGKGVAAANALKDQVGSLRAIGLLNSLPPPVDARLAKTIARFEAPIFAVPSASVPRVALAVAARTLADLKSALLRAQLGMRGSTAPTQQAAGSSATPTSGNYAAPTPVAADVEKAAEKGVHGIDRYIGKSCEKMQLAYVHSIAYVVYGGFVSKMLMDELIGLDTAELERWRKVWEEVKILPTGMWTVMWARGVLLPKIR